MVASFGVVVEEGFTNPQTSQTIASALVILHNFTVRPHGTRHMSHWELKLVLARNLYSYRPAFTVLEGAGPILGEKTSYQPYLVVNPKSCIDDQPDKMFPLVH